MGSKNDEKWLANDEALKAYLDEHHHLPDKHKVEFRGLLNWAKYQRKRIKEGSLDEEKARLFEELMATRSDEHTGGRKPPPTLGTRVRIDDEQVTYFPSTLLRAGLVSRRT